MGVAEAPADGLAHPGLLPWRLLVCSTGGPWGNVAWAPARLLRAAWDLEVSVPEDWPGRLCYRGQRREATEGTDSSQDPATQGVLVSPVLHLVSLGLRNL